MPHPFKVWHRWLQKGSISIFASLWAANCFCWFLVHGSLFWETKESLFSWSSLSCRQILFLKGGVFPTILPLFPVLGKKHLMDSVQDGFRPSPREWNVFPFPFFRFPQPQWIFNSVLRHRVCCPFSSGLTLLLLRGEGTRWYFAFSPRGCNIQGGRLQSSSCPTLCLIDFLCTWRVLSTWPVHGGESSECEVPCVCDSKGFYSVPLMYTGTFTIHWKFTWILFILLCEDLIFSSCSDYDSALTLSFLWYQSSWLFYYLSFLMCPRNIIILYIILLFLVIRVGVTLLPAFFILGGNWRPAYIQEKNFVRCRTLGR